MQISINGPLETLNLHIYVHIRIHIRLCITMYGAIQMNAQE